MKEARRGENGMKIERLGPYQIIRELGRGGMGTVYEGVHLETGEPTAVKLLAVALSDDEGFRERFEAEIETLRKLNHPNIVRLFGFGQQDGLCYYAMEFVQGSSLEQELSVGRRFSWFSSLNSGAGRPHLAGDDDFPLRIASGVPMPEACTATS